MPEVAYEVRLAPDGDGPFYGFRARRPLTKIETAAGHPRPDSRSVKEIKFARIERSMPID